MAYEFVRKVRQVDNISDFDTGVLSDGDIIITKQRDIFIKAEGRLVKLNDVTVTPVAPPPTPQPTGGGDSVWTKDVFDKMTKPSDDDVIRDDEGHFILEGVVSRTFINEIAQMAQAGSNTSYDLMELTERVTALENK